MESFPAFLVTIKTNFGKIIACFVDSKFESTRDMICEVNGEKKPGKLINNDIMFYFLDDQLVKCPWKNQQKPIMVSTDKFFLATKGIDINHNRDKKDFALVDDICYSGSEQNNSYPHKYSGESI